MQQMWSDFKRYSTNGLLTMKIMDNAAGPTGGVSIFIAKLNEPGAFLTLLPDTPSEWLIFFSTALVLCQLLHWFYRFVRWINAN